MHMDLFPRQCVSCPSQLPACTCSADESCVLITQSCDACPTFTCRPNAPSKGGGSGGGVSPGALAGVIVAVLLILTGTLLVFFLYRRRQRARQARNVTVEPKPDVPAPAEAVLNRPDPTEKPPSSTTAPTAPTTPTTPSIQTNVVRVYSSTGDSVIDLDPQSQGSHKSSTRRASGKQSIGNPFDDGQSIQTTSTATNGTNVIPIALVSPGSVQLPSPRSSSSFPPNSPVRPARPTDLVLDSPHGSLDSLSKPSPRYAQSQRSGVSGASFSSNASYSSDFLNEAPMIITHAQGAVRQVVGKVKAEVIQTSGAVTPTSHLSSESLKPSSAMSRPSIRSPLAATSFGPADVVNEADEEHELSACSDPFGDHHTPSKETSAASFVSRGGTDSAERVSLAQPRSAVNEVSTPRANIGILGARSDQKSPHGISIPKLIPPSVPSGTLQEQQQRALAHAQAQARAQGLDRAKRMSGTSMVSTTSTRADSILESFPFVPPSPIASRPVRSPPRSPLSQQSTTAQPQASKAGPSTASPLPTLPQVGIAEIEAPLDPPNRRILGMSTGSQLSTASSGLGNFPFQIDHGGIETTHPPLAPQERQRASLDTLALMSDLSSYPLGYDRDDHASLPPLPKN